VFNSKRIEALEARIAALEPKRDECGDPIDPIKSLSERLEKVEREVIADDGIWSYMIFTRYFGGGEGNKKLTLRDKVDRLCEHLKIKFVTEPQRTVIKPVKQKREHE
jgi:hypothetical protein